MYRRGASPRETWKRVGSGSSLAKAAAVTTSPSSEEDKTSKSKRDEKVTGLLLHHRKEIHVRQCPVPRYSIKKLSCTRCFAIQLRECKDDKTPLK